jgi:hypothetical protein
MRAAWKATVGPRETRSGRERMSYTQEGLRLTFASWEASAEGKEGFWMAAVSGLKLESFAESHAEASSSSTPTTAPEDSCGSRRRWRYLLGPPWQQ